MGSRSQEVWVGVFVTAGLVALLFLALRVSNFADYRTGDVYTLYAGFDNVGGLRERAPVTMGGVRIGRVAAIAYDLAHYRARVTLEVSTDYDELPQDTTASIRTAGLIGEQFVSLEPGGAPEVLKDRDEIQLTQSAVVIEQLIGQFLYGQASGGKEQGGGPAAPGGADMEAKP